MSEKLCCFCKNAEMAYSYYESMGGQEWYECGKGHFSYISTQIPFSRKEMLKAETCPDYDPADE